MPRSLLPLSLCVVLWSSGELSVTSPLAPQGIVMEYRVLWCPPGRFVVDEAGTEGEIVPATVRVQTQVRAGRAFSEWTEIARGTLSPDGTLSTTENP